MNVKADTITVTTDWQEVDPLFDITYYGLYAVNGSIISESFDGTDWGNIQSADIGGIIAAYVPGTKIRIKAQSGSVIVNYSLRGFKVISVGVVAPPASDVVMSHAEGEYKRITELQYNPVTGKIRVFYDTEDLVESVIRSYATGDWKRITTMQYDVVNDKIKVLYEV